MNTSHKYFDVTVIGGGLHGAAIAADCAGRGLRTLLCHRGDVGGSHGLVSNRLFHCGLQYLQRGDIAKVNESLEEKEILNSRAQHLIQPTNVIIPQKPSITSSLKLNTKAFLYNLIAKNKAQLNTKDISNTEFTEPLCSSDAEGKQLAICFQDSIINDSQLTIENLLLAQDKGAVILPHTNVSSAKRLDGEWVIELSDSEIEYSATVTSRSIVNATGPAARHVQEDILGISSRSSANNYQAVYFVTKKLFEGNQTYLLETDDSNLVSVMTYMDEYSLIGPFIYSTTAESKQSSTEIPQSVRDDLVELVNNQLKTQISAEDIIHQFSIFSSSYKETGADQPTPFSQDYVLDFNCSDGRSPSVTLFGTCINMHRLIAEQVIEQLSPYLSWQTANKTPWTKNEILPGGNCSPSLETYMLAIADSHPWLPVNILNRYITHYGSRTKDMLNKCGCLADLGEEILPGLYEREIRWLYEQEWANTADSIIWHRTKLGLSLNEKELHQFNQWFSARYPYQSPLMGLQMGTEMNKQAS